MTAALVKGASIRLRIAPLASTIGSRIGTTICSSFGIQRSATIPGEMVFCVGWYATIFRTLNSHNRAGSAGAGPTPFEHRNTNDQESENGQSPLNSVRQQNLRTDLSFLPSHNRGILL